MKVSTRTYLERKDGRLNAGFSAEGCYEHGRLPGMVDLAEYLDILHLQEKGILDDEGHRIPVTVLTLGMSPVSLAGVESYMQTEVDGPFYAAWTAGREKLAFMVAATNIEGMRALRIIYRAAVEGRAFADFAEMDFQLGLKLVAIEDTCGNNHAQA